MARSSSTSISPKLRFKPWSPLGRTHSIDLKSLSGGRGRRSDAELAFDLQRTIQERHRADGAGYTLSYYDRSLQTFLEVDAPALIHSPDAVTNTAYAPLSLVQLHRSGGGKDGLLGSKSSLAARPHHYEGGIVRKGGSIVPPAPRIYPAEPNLDTTTPVVIVAYRYVYVREADSGDATGEARGDAAGAAAVTVVPADGAGADGTTGSPAGTAAAGGAHYAHKAAPVQQEAVTNPRLVAALDHLMNRGMLQHQESDTIVDPVTHERNTYRLTLVTPTEITVHPENTNARTVHALGFPIRVSHANDANWPVYQTPFALPLGRWCVKAEAYVPLLDSQGHNRGDVAIGPSAARTFTVMHGAAPTV